MDMTNPHLSTFTRAHRGQTEPLAALGAVFAVCVGITLFVGAYGAAIPEGTDRDLAEPTLERTVSDIGDGGAINPFWLELVQNQTTGDRPVDEMPTELPPGLANSSKPMGSEESVQDWFGSLSPAGYDHNVTIVSGNHQWSAGPQPPEAAETASRRVTVERSPGRVGSGRLIVEVWS